MKPHTVYKKIKPNYPHVLLLFKVNCHLEAYGTDADRLSHTLKIPLDRVENRSQRTGIRVCRFPSRSAKQRIAKLVAAGHRVAILEQIKTAPKGAEIKRTIV